jgi:hypothetical protein
MGGLRYITYRAKRWPHLRFSHYHIVGLVGFRFGPDTGMEFGDFEERVQHLMGVVRV